MSKIDDGGPAFPIQEPQAIHSYAAAAVADIPYTETDKRDAEYMKARGKAIGGMSRRDHYAGQAVIGLMLNAKRNPISDEEIEWVANTSFRVADAMIRARKAGAE